MLINGLHHSTYGIIGCDVDIQVAQITTYDEWLRKSNAPTAVGCKETFKLITCKFFFRGNSKQSVTEKISNLATVLKRCTIQPDNSDFIYACTYDAAQQSPSKTQKYNGLQQVFTTQLQSGYAYKPPVTVIMNNVTTKVINVDGNIATDATVTVTVPINTISLTLTGFGEDNITINNLHANISVVISGEDCTVLENANNKFSDTDMWEFPSLQPGNNTIATSTSNCTIQIQYKPRWI
jgi:phage-related protein